MKFKYVNPEAIEPVMTYGQMLKDGDAIDSSAWGEKEAHFIEKAKKSSLYRPLTTGDVNAMYGNSVSIAPDDGEPFVATPVKRGRKPKAVAPE